MKNMKIKVKLIFLFIVMKIIPLLAISYIAYDGVMKLDLYLNNSTKLLFNQSKEIIENTANLSIEDSVKNLDKKSQESLEKISYELANKVAEFLYERDKDLLLLSKLELNQKTLESFFDAKNKNIIIHGDYYYDDKSTEYKTDERVIKEQRANTKANLSDNEKEFNYIDPVDFGVKSIPIYKELSYFDLSGKEIYKVSSINPNKLDVSNKKNTYVNSESYFEEISKLKENEIYVSDVIGEYVGSNVIGTFTKEKAKKAGIEFEPEKYGYAGIENPLGKRFEGILRFITPVYKDNKKVGYVSMALDHRHIREFTDTSNPTGSSVKQNISDARLGNYAFMWDYEGKNISHPRDYSIVGYDKNTGQRVMPWLSADLAEKFYASNKDINEFLKDYPTFEEQSLSKKPNLKQLKELGVVPLDCRYLNFAPQCEGWMQLTKNGGYGSFVIYWSNVWKLSTAATIPYYTGKYANSKRGFGFVSIGASVDDFHAAANKTKEDVLNILKNQTKSMETIVNANQDEIKDFINILVNELTLITISLVLIIIFIAVWMSDYIISKINNLLIGTKKFANNELDYRIKVTSNDEIGELENSFNNMAKEINTLISTQRELNEHLEDKVDEKTKELLQINENLEKEVGHRTESLKDALLKAQNSDKVKSTFLANMSHEIRTPLNSIIGFSELLTNNSDIDESAKKYSSIIEESAKSLLIIINDILDISKIESGNFDINIKQTNINEVCRNVFELFSNKANDKNINFNFSINKDIPNCLLSDGIRIRQVLSNLISNAIKFTNENGEIDFKVSFIQEKNNFIKLRFLVKDSGIGIPSTKLANIFEPFIQVDNESNRKYEGTGLGLSISSHIIKLLGSKIEISSEIDVGSSFWFDLELETCVNTSIDLEQKEIVLNNNYAGEILVAEDNTLNQELIKYILESLGLNYKIVANGKDAINEYKNGVFNLILMDINMPIVDGIEAFNEIREYEKNNNLINIPIIALTANVIKGDKEKFLNLGMNGYLTKPINMNELKKVFSIYLSSDNEIKSLEINTNNSSDILQKIKNLDDKIIVNFNKNDVINQLGLDEITIDMLLDNFFLTLDSDIKKLQDAIDLKDSDKIVQASHYLKGSCSSLVMKDAVEILQEIESEGRKGKTQFNLKRLNLIFEKIKAII
jgi:signal transduction histidine kinase/AmiR/NasT family two-component response regulator/HPt (histidine-containing phosphotransfer) domain-containing protein